MCDGCDSFPLGCGSPSCLTGEEALEERWQSYKGDRLIQPKMVEGFNKLAAEHQQLFSSFLDHFYKRWGFPERHIPVAVTSASDKSNGDYLRVDFNDGNWLHVKDSWTWY